jgi:sortase A
MALFEKRKIRGRRSIGMAPKTANQAARLSSQLNNNEQLPEMTSRTRILRGMLGMTTIFIVAFLLNLMLFSHLFHMSEQTRLRNEFRDQLAASIAPTAEVDFEKRVLPQGAPVAVIQIPQLGIDEVVSEGTDSATLRSGPGHRRDTVLPGQQGVSIIMGRASAYGGPFGSLQSLKAGTRFTVITGQGKQTFESLGIRYAGDLSLPPVASKESRLILATARGSAYNPQGMVYYDALLVSEAQPRGIRVTNTSSLSSEDREFGFDLRFGWALVLTLQLLIALEIAAIWCWRNFGSRSTYLVFTPLLLFASILVVDQATRLLPNLL